MYQNSLRNQTSVLQDCSAYTKRIINWKTCYRDQNYCEHNNRIQSIEQVSLIEINGY
ncbi:hypothetical protein SAMN02746066_01882 [Anaerosporobacter mobilis DSM 15930]|uniref:Uncharacterized protein n=1 Tax=Anaerosporobacter mobilis DSM 15930 TaxID=1120996 RepID=A0A1M7III3_9FIRM|nr:hypothetical protein [Anaerosporobacter mobilis]SHM40479.1 hypothetical protein SAMN02746066_01882 [Anaerosporobacter mobilis DSM 15930]